MLGRKTGSRAKRENRISRKEHRKSSKKPKGRKREAKAAAYVSIRRPDGRTLIFHQSLTNRLPY